VNAERAPALTPPGQDRLRKDGSESIDAAMARYAAGDDSAFLEVFYGLAPRVQAFLCRLCGSVDLAHDLTQETFLKIHRARGSFASGHALVPWAYAIARNCFVSHARSGKVKARRKSVTLEDYEPVTGLEASAEESASARESAEIVERVLADMSVVNREAFILLRFEGLSVAEAARVLGASEGAVKLRAFRAYEALRAALGKAEPLSGARNRARAGAYPASIPLGGSGPASRNARTP
jgi:RNA polymerase sigma-70 factor (ECF subfamily)